MTRLALALDVPNKQEALILVDQTKKHVDIYKIGLQLFISEGPDLVREIAKSSDVFLDLKLHDIPATVERAVKSAGDLGVKYLTIHASGGSEMIKAAVEAAKEFDITILAVTILTSLSEVDLFELGFMNKEVRSHVINLATGAYQAGARGFVCSPQEVYDLNRFLITDKTIFSPREITLVTPGIRLAQSNDDQKRVATPEKAIEDGADILVVGRPIRDAENPADAAAEFKEIINGT